ncbi:dTDP-4-amino-4,6-dideoxygalactose transaminase [Selenomonas sp.]|uniref:dTDP-4-amino-4,6-dideoxygalactose transaminase n=1 Tax=Selenomonas sp. TaxID=2053611 RepID=UPI002A7FE19C|nr:dTDP-4-amino-4,6-dideoxygalactose transaminase [Selenomonas sp.]MDY4415841.1 dTDP-4-amino-4,6-dideoxygalactose transaminase [Selenomonas sp.]
MRKPIPFNRPICLEKSIEYMNESARCGEIRGDFKYCHKCSELLEKKFDAPKVLLTNSGTDALEMAAILCDIKPGDEVILPSFTFSSTANAFVLRGAKLVFVDIRPDTMNIDERLIEAAITPQTRVVVAVHYGGVACKMDTIEEVAHRHHLLVVEDAAQAVMSTYHGKHLGTIGDFGCYSFHETKNYSMGEGGAIVINNEKYVDRAQIIREKGTNRSQFLQGLVDKYTWVDVGSSFLPSDLNAAFLYPQLEQAEEINQKRMHSWNLYYALLESLVEAGKVQLPKVPDGCIHNAHLFYIKMKDVAERIKLIRYLKKYQVTAVFHYIPLHSAPAGQKFGRFYGEDRYTTIESNRLLRLPMYFDLSDEDVRYIVGLIKEFYDMR